MISRVVGKKAPANKYASATRFSDRMVLHSYLVTPYGNFASEPFRVLELNATPEVMAATVLEVLNASREAEDMPHGKGLAKWYAERMGAKTQAALQRGTLYVGLMTAGGVIEFSPTHNGGTAGDEKGFQPNGNAAVTMTVGASAGEIAEGLGKAFGLCTSVYG